MSEEDLPELGTVSWNCETREYEVHDLCEWMSLQQDFYRYRKPSRLVLVEYHEDEATAKQNRAALAQAESSRRYNSFFRERSPGPTHWEDSLQGVMCDADDQNYFLFLRSGRALHKFAALMIKRYDGDILQVLSATPLKASKMLILELRTFSGKVLTFSPTKVREPGADALMNTLARWGLMQEAVGAQPEAWGPVDHFLRCEWSHTYP